MKRRYRVLSAAGAIPRLDRLYLGSTGLILKTVHNMDQILSGKVSCEGCYFRAITGNPDGCGASDRKRCGFKFADPGHTCLCGDCDSRPDRQFIFVEVDRDGNIIDNSREVPVPEAG